MAFASTVVKRANIGSVKLVVGTFSNIDTDSGGNIDTGLTNLFFFNASADSHVGSTVLKHTITAGSSTVAVVCDNGVDGRWMAVGI